MSTKLAIKVLATLLSPDQREIVASQVTLDFFAPDVLDTQLSRLLSLAVAALRAEGFTDPKTCQLELSMQLSSDESGLRPALHLSKLVLEQLAAVGASLDFDPYCAT
jgi:hypothetical protein